ncbi:MAG: VacJ family lipoprotein [Caulobacteraceae bacterium]|nr:VacJ family lipoprotein [Caulobacteraceae bacterium]
MGPGRPGDRLGAIAGWIGWSGVAVRRGLRHQLCGVLAVATLVAGPARAMPGDPLERLNRRFYAINAVLDRALIRPLSRVSAGLTPGPIGRVIKNVLTNISEPVVILNDVLQMRPMAAGRASARLIVNTTVGIAGAIDVAARLGVRHHDNGFGDTLGRYGLGPGPYLYLPLLGPSDLRDLTGAAADTFVDPLTWGAYPYKTEVGLTLAAVGGLGERAEADRDLQTLLEGAADPYATLRSTYLQLRQGQIEGREGATDALPPLPDLGEPSPGAPVPHTPGEPRALGPLPGDQGRDAGGQLPRPPDQGEGEGDVRRQAEQGADQGVAGLLHADAHGGHEGRAAGDADQGLQRQDAGEGGGNPR